jgi:hypothetical protein
LDGGKKFKTRTAADLSGIRGQIESEPFPIYKMNLKKQENNSKFWLLVAGCLPLAAHPLLGMFFTVCLYNGQPVSGVYFILKPKVVVL